MNKSLLTCIVGTCMLFSCNNHSEEGHKAHSHDHATDLHKHEAYSHDHDHDHDTDLHRHEAHDHDHDHDTDLHRHEAVADEEVHADNNEILLPPDKARAAGVEVSEIQPGNFRQVIKTSGQILTAQGDENMAVATVAGIVSIQNKVIEGMSVNKGTPLFVLSSKNMAEGDPVQKAFIAYETAKKEYERAKALVENRIVSEKEFAQVKQAYENARISYEAVAQNQTEKGQVVASPINGYVKELLVKEGDYVSVGQPLASITQNRRLFLRADVSEKYYKELGNIESANFMTPYYDKVYSLDGMNGRLLSYGKSSGNDGYYIPVIFEFDNKGDVIPGSFVEVYLLGKPMQGVITIPETALTEEQGSYYVYRQLDEECYEKQLVSIGQDDGLQVQILDGVQAGDRIVTKGAYQVKLASATNAIPAHTHEH